MRYAEVYVKATSELAKTAAEAINKLSFDAGFASAFNEKELADCIAQFKQQISECHPDIAKDLVIESVELNSDDVIQILQNI